MTTDFDAIVVGAGAVGLGCGYALARNGHNVAVLERERRVGAGISSRNSEVIHAGLHYPPGSLKARFCVEGRRLLYAFLDRHHVAYYKCGKLIVATQASELDAHGYMDALVGEIDAHGGDEPSTVTTRRLILAGGLQAQEMAATVHGFPADRIPALHFGKGSYFALAGHAPFQRLVYPPPIPGALGIHYRRDLGGQARFGPDLEYVDAPDYQVDPQRMRYFEDYVRRFWPGLPDGALTPDYAGIRPKLHGPGEPRPDFVIDDTQPGVIALFGIECPGLTASLAIGEHVAGLASH